MKQIITYLICFVGFLMSFGTVNASPSRSAGTDGLACMSERINYPAIFIWTSMHDASTTGCLLSLVQEHNPRLDAERSLALVNEILASAIMLHLDPLLIASVIAAESSFNPRARSSCGAQGLMQLTPPIQPWLGVRDPFDIKQNIAGGCQYLSYLEKRFVHVELILAAYNSGPTRVARLGRVPNILETIYYIKRVFKLRSRLQKEVDNQVKLIAGRLDPDPFGLA